MITQHVLTPNSCRCVALSLLAAVLAGCGGSLTATPETTSAPQAPGWDLAATWHTSATYERMYSTDLTPHWLADGQCFWYRYARADGRRYWLVDPRQGTRAPLFDHTRLAAEIERLSGEEQGGTELDLSGVEVDLQQQRITFTANGRRYRLDRTTGVLSAVEAQPRPEPAPVWQNNSPDGRLTIFQRGNNLFVANHGSGGPAGHQLSTDGAPAFIWDGVEDHVANDDTTRRRAEGIWSPDSRFFAIRRHDARNVGDLWLIDHLAQPRPTLRTFKYAMPGEPVVQESLWVYDHATGGLKEIDAARWPDQTFHDLFTDIFWWTPDSRFLVFARKHRDYTKVDVCLADPTAGIAFPVIEERTAGMVYVKEPNPLPDGSGAVWWSARDGWGHLYLARLDGSAPRQLTSGSFHVEEAVSVDAEDGSILFRGKGREPGRNPYYGHLYRVGLGGSGVELLTPEDADHACHVSPDGQVFVDNYSRPDLPTRCVLRRRDGSLVMELEETDTSALMAAGWQPPRVFAAKAADGDTDLWGVLHRPHVFDPSHRYPVVTRVYPGRQSEGVYWRFNPPSPDATLAQLGCVVLQFGNRGGTPERGLAYREYGRDDFRDYGLADKKVVIEELAQRLGYLDLDRVGIYGSSSGGFMTVSAMLTFPEFFKVGVAMSGPHDPSVYFNIWAERYGELERVADATGNEAWDCRVEGNLELADQLAGKLLLIHGTRDDNVHPTHTYRLADALIKAGKTFDMFMIPGADHGLGDWQYLYGLVWDYFAEHLMDNGRGSAEAWKPASP